MSKVLIFGAGMGGLSAAQELVERGLQVEVYEKRKILGGKARSVEKAGTATGTRKPLPGEDGFRFFPGFYTHVPDTMSRIPFNGGTVFNNLVAAKEIGVLQEGKLPYIFPSDTPTTVDEWRRAIELLFTRPELGLPHDEALFFAGRILCLFSSCDSRRFGEYEHLSWWKFIDADNKSEQYKKMCAKGLTRSLVAMRSEVASTRSVGTILIQILLDIILTNRAGDRVLNGPTNEVWIDPWETYLISRGVRINRQYEVLALNFDQTTNRIKSVTIKDPNGAVSDVQGDYYILAMPVDVLNGRSRSSPLITPEIRQAAPSLANLDQVQTAWMVGIQFYLNRQLTTPIGHAIYADSTWAVTSIAQAQFWPGNFSSKYGNGAVMDILSCDISEWNEAGNKVFHDKAINAGSQNDIKDEVWAQLKAHWAASPSNNQLHDTDLADWYLSPQIEWVNGRPFNTEPLLINTIDSRRFRPEAKIPEIPNLFLASDYVITHTDLATMEAANEAGRRAANAILDAEAYAGSRAAVWPLQEPAIFDPLKRADEDLYALGLPSPLCMSLPMSSLSTPPPPIPPTTLDWIMLALLVGVAVLLVIILLILVL